MPDFKSPTTLSPVDSQSHYKIISDEIQRHLEDSELSKLSHFYAAARYDNIHKYYLGLPTAVVALFLSWLITQKETDIGNGALIYSLKIILGMFVTVSTGIGAFLNFNEMASRHRIAAQKYQAVWRNCKNWATDFPDEQNLNSSQEKAKDYRKEMTRINKEAPQIPNWAYINGRKQQEKGVTSYEIDKPIIT